MPQRVFWIIGCFLLFMAAGANIQKIVVGLIIAAVVVVAGFILFSFAACIFAPSWVNKKEKGEKKKKEKT